MFARRASHRLLTSRNGSTLVFPRGITTHPPSSFDYRTNLSASRGKKSSGIRQLSSQGQTANSRHEVKHQNEHSSSEVEESLLKEELRAIEQAESAEVAEILKKYIHEALQNDSLAEQIKKSEVDDAEDSQIESLATNTADSRISRLREVGAPIEDVAREARNIHGEHLPDSVLSPEEKKIYTRLYGEPLSRSTSHQDYHLEQLDSEDGDHTGNVLLNAEGQEISYRLEDEAEIERSMHRQSERPKQGAHRDSENIAQTASDEFDLEAIAKAVEGDVCDQEEFDEWLEEDDEAADDRVHPLTRIGRFSTFPRTFFMPKDTFTNPVQQIMSNFSNKQLKEMCEKTFGGPGLPDSPLTPRIGPLRRQFPIPLDASQHSMGQMEANAFVTTVMPPTYASIQAVLVETRKRLGPSWLNLLLAKPDGPRILDAGSGGVGILAWRDVLNAHWEQLHSSDRKPPPLPVSKSVVLTGSDTLRHRAASMLENTTFVPRLPDYVHTRDVPTLEDDRPAQQRKKFDVIIASHSLFGLKEEWERKQHLQNLWQLLSDQGGVLIIVEKGIPRGFEAVAAAREMLLERYIAVPDGQKTYYSAEQPVTNLEEGDMPHKMPGMIIAPCTNHDRCPLYKAAGVSKGRKDICSFQQRYIRPAFLQRVLGAITRNHDDVDFSYVAVMKGEDFRQRSFSSWDHVNDPMSAPKTADQASTTSMQQSTILQIQTGFESSNPSSSESPFPPPTHLLPRILNAPLKRHGHVTIDICTPTAEIRRWTVPKSFSRQAYRDARKARWGDLWALGAKTSVMRNLKTGTPAKDLEGAGGQIKGLSGKPHSRKDRLQVQAEKLRAAEEAQQDEDEKEHEELMRLIDEDNPLDEDDNEDDGLIDMDTLLPKKKTARTYQSKREPPSPPKKQSRPEQAVKAPKRTLEPKRRTRDEIVIADTGPERMGEVDSLAAWSDEYVSATLEEEAYQRASHRGYRPTSKNTQRMKRDLRRAKKQSGADSLERQHGGY